MNCKIEHILISSDHNFVGHYGAPPGTNPAIRKDKVRLIEGRGIEGDRYSRRETGHRKQITFFDMATIDLLAKEFGDSVKPELVRRNVFIRGVDLPGLVGRKFVVQGMRFLGVDPCPPCDWMNVSVGDGARQLMEGKGGLRAEILQGGVLSVGPAEFELLEEGDEK